MSDEWRIGWRWLHVYHSIDYSASPVVHQRGVRIYVRLRRSKARLFDISIGSAAVSIHEAAA